MKIKSIVFAAAVMAATQVSAAHLWEDPSGWWGNHFTRGEPGAPRFLANEFSLDLFGSYNAAESGIEDVFETNIRHGDWGGGAGLNYFFLREVGVGVDMNMSDNRGELVDNVNGSLILRLPIESVGLAPYIFGGGGRAFDPSWEWTAHAGVGLEARFSPWTGIFADARYVWADKSYDRILFRAGFRLVF